MVGIALSLHGGQWQVSECSHPLEPGLFEVERYPTRHYFLFQTDGVRLPYIHRDLSLP